MSVGPVRLDGDCPVKGRSRRVELAIVVERIGEIVLRLGQVGLDGDRPAKGGDRLFEFALRLERQAELHMQLGIVRLGCQNAPITSLGLGQSSGLVGLQTRGQQLSDREIGRAAPSSRADRFVSHPISPRRGVPCGS